MCFRRHGPLEHKTLVVVTQNEMHTRADRRSRVQDEDDWRNIRARRRFGVTVCWSRGPPVPKGCRDAE